MRLRALSSAALLLACSLFAAPAARAGAGDGVAHLTVYDAGIAQFLEERTVELQPGLNTVEWRSLMPRAFLRTLRVTVEGADVVRQNVTMDGPEVGDSRTPVLHLVIDNRGAAGARRVRVDYLAPGLKWQNDYALVLEPGAGGAPPTSATLDAWVAVHNDTGADLTAGVVDLVAGDISLLVGDDSASWRRQREMVAQNVVGFVGDADESGELGAEVGGLSAFNRFTLGRDLRMTANAPVNRFPLFQRARIAVEERKVFENAHNQQTLGRGDFIMLPRGLEVRIVSRNTTGAPMPAGLVTVYARSGEMAQIVGQDRVAFVPQGIDFSVSQGRSATLLGTRRIAERREAVTGVTGDEARRKLTTKVEVTLSNRGAVPAEAYVREGVERYADNRWTVLESSHQSERLGDNTIQFRVTVPAGGTTTVAYTVEVR